MYPNDNSKYLRSAQSVPGMTLHAPFLILAYLILIQKAYEVGPILLPILQVRNFLLTQDLILKRGRAGMGTIWLCKDCNLPIRTSLAKGTFSSQHINASEWT